ncbi:MAG TPA: hypothetical protein VFZ09_27985 [Archangium sp.]|uniref:hypothetical protein n=1 Tax=Archangium sp. TaxID=1872627 RepID=UPI002E2EC1D9|nr:hypothetical protein [Archangium sp.]HEX5750102.1 hypothetical protein [Archangium sp.]
MREKGAWETRDSAIRKGFEELGAKRINHGNELRVRIKLLADRGFCVGQAVGWLTQQNRDGRASTFVFSPNADGQAGGHPALRLNKLKSLDDGALLTVVVVVEQRTTRVSSFSIGIQGKGRMTQVPWYARVDFTEAPAGQGPCGHPLLHCHVGQDPNVTGEPEIRVPHAWMKPAEVLDWLLATVDPSLEP